MIKSRRSSPRLSAKQLQKQEKSNSIQSLLKVTPILNGDRMLLYLPTMRRFDFDSHSLLSQRFVPFSNSQRKKKRERLHWPKSSPREWQRGRGGDGRSAKKETMHRETEKERVILYLPYTRQSAYRSPQEMRYSWESYVAETEADTRAIVILWWAHLNRRRRCTHWRRRGMKMRGDDCLRRAGKRNLGRGRKESAWSGRRGAKGGLRLANMSISKGKRETDVTVERDNRPFFPCDTLCGIFNLCVINKYVNSRNCKDENGEYDQLVNSNIDENSFQNELSSIRKSS